MGRNDELGGTLETSGDASAGVALREVNSGLRDRNIELHLERATVELQRRFDDLGLTEVIGADHIHGTVSAAVAACELPPGTAP